MPPKCIRFHSSLASALGTIHELQGDFWIKHLASSFLCCCRVLSRSNTCIYIYIHIDLNTQRCLLQYLNTSIQRVDKFVQKINIILCRNHVIDSVYRRKKRTMSKTKSNSLTSHTNPRSKETNKHAFSFTPLKIWLIKQHKCHLPTQKKQRPI